MRRESIARKKEERLAEVINDVWKVKGFLDEWRESLVWSIYNKRDKGKV